MYLFYNIVFSILFILAFPYLIIRGIFGRHGVLQRLGRLPQPIRQLAQNGNLIWIHAASVGEVKALGPLVDAIKSYNPSYKIILSNTTKTGKKQAERSLKNVDGFIFAPVDLPWVVQHVMKTLKPKILILIETELWPNMIRKAKENRSVVSLVNGRISPRSYKRYLYFKPLCQAVLEYVDLFCMQTEEDVNRIKTIGAHPDKIVITGNLKFEAFLWQKLEKRFTKESLKLPPDLRLLVAGSTRPGEEEIILESYRKLKEQFPNLLLILAPRHLKRLRSIEELLTQRRFSYVRKSRWLKKTDQSRIPQVLILDSMGELAELYGLADLAFVGGSLVPLGGHNPLEPAIYGVPVLFGPHVEHFRKAADILIEAQAAVQVKNSQEFADSALKFLNNNREPNILAQKVKTAIQANSGTAQNSIKEIFKLVK